jgi:hypothetical protein
VKSELKLSLSFGRKHLATLASLRRLKTALALDFGKEDVENNKHTIQDCITMAFQNEQNTLEVSSAQSIFDAGFAVCDYTDACMLDSLCAIAPMHPDAGASEKAESFWRMLRVETLGTNGE